MTGIEGLPRYQRLDVDALHFAFDSPNASKDTALTL